MNDRNADYRGTINLPQTQFPMQAQLARREPERLARWQAEDLYRRVDEATADRPSYRLIDGPPYANGDIHIGHAVNKVLKDIVCKVARLDGFHAPFVPGWDCHGLPIELQVEKKHGKVGAKVDAGRFRDLCREYALGQIDRQREDFKRLGVLADWEKPYLTMDPRFEAEQLRVLARIVENGHLARGGRPVHWCLDCHSSLAEAEVEYQDKTSPAIDVAFEAVIPENWSGLQRAAGNALAGTKFVIWTTTPWTLPGNQAICVHPGFDYVLADFGALGRLVVAEQLLEACATRYGVEAPAILKRFGGNDLYGLQARHPFADRTVPVLLGEHVTLEAGTGLVHTAPAHGLDDYRVCRRDPRLPSSAFDNPVGNDGCFVAGTPLVAGMHVRKADVPIIDALRERGALVHQSTVSHSYPHCWRHKTPLIFRATPQWFIAMDAAGLRAHALEAIGNTKWIPAWGENRIREMVAGRPDWCVSRQRYWGVPLALFRGTRSDDLIDPGEYTQEKPSGREWPAPSAAEREEHRQRAQAFAADTLRRVADVVEREGANAWFQALGAWVRGDGSYLFRFLPDQLHEALQARVIEPVRDTLDVWFDSGSVHQGSFAATDPAKLDADGLAPQADLYLEGSDQHRGWFQSSLLTSVAMRGTAPYKAVLTHGFTVDEQGRKMSKSIGNVVAPQAVTHKLGADILRLWVAGSDYAGEIAISDNLLVRVADGYRRIRNTARFLLGNLHGFDPAADPVPTEELLALDRWALARAGMLQQELIEAYREAQFHIVCQKLHHYCVVELGGLYLDVLKDRLYTMPAKSAGRRSAQTVMWHIAEALARWVAPILSFTADEVWEHLPGDHSETIFAQRWHRMPEIRLGATDAARWQRLRAVREPVFRALENARNAGQIGGGLDAAVVLRADAGTLEALCWLGEELRFWLIVSAVDSAPLGETESREATELEGGGRLVVEIARSRAAKCARCWQRRPEVGGIAEHPALCGRCVENLGAGERRRYC